MTTPHNQTVRREPWPKCLRCGLDRREHAYNGACIGVPGEFLNNSIDWKTHINSPPAKRCDLMNITEQLKSWSEKYPRAHGGDHGGQDLIDAARKGDFAYALKWLENSPEAITGDDAGRELFLILREAQVAEWANSETGRAELIATRDSARKAAARIADAVRVPPEMMMQKMGPVSRGSATEDIAALSRSAINDIAAERQRQIDVEGWTPDHDDQHASGQLAAAAGSYALAKHPRLLWVGGNEFPLTWPWHRRWWKPKDRRRDLIRAGALIVAEIERLDRAAV